MIFLSKMEKKRSNQMNKSLHLLFNQVCNELVAQGIDQKTIVMDLQGYDTPVTPTFMKEVWRSIMYTMFRKTSTTELTNKEMSDCYEVFHKFIAENYGINNPWPSIESLMFNEIVDNPH